MYPRGAKPDPALVVGPPAGRWAGMGKRGVMAGTDPTRGWIKGSAPTDPNAGAELQALQAETVHHSSD